MVRRGTSLGEERKWESLCRDIPVDTKCIQHQGLHSMASATVSPDETYIGAQCMDNRIVLFQVSEACATSETTG